MVNRKLLFKVMRSSQLKSPQYRAFLKRVAVKVIRNRKGI